MLISWEKFFGHVLRSRGRIHSWLAGGDTLTKHQGGEPSTIRSSRKRVHRTVGPEKRCEYLVLRENIDTWRASGAVDCYDFSARYQRTARGAVGALALPLPLGRTREGKILRPNIATE